MSSLEESTNNQNNNEPVSNTTDEKKTESLDDGSDIQVKLLSKTGEVFSISKKYTCISDLIFTMFNGDKEANEISLNLDSKQLKLAVEYMKHHKGEEPPLVERPLKSKIMSENVKDPWDTKYIDDINTNPDNIDEISEMCNTSNYLGIKSLVHLACAKVASIIKGKSKEEMKKLLNIEEEKKVGENNSTDQLSAPSENTKIKNEENNSVNQLSASLENIKIKNEEKEENNSVD